MANEDEDKWTLSTSVMCYSSNEFKGCFKMIKINAFQQ